MAEQNPTLRASAAQPPNGRNAAQIREGLAPGKKEAQLQLADGTPLSGWLASPAAFDTAVAEALNRSSRPFRSQHIPANPRGS